MTNKIAGKSSKDKNRPKSAEKDGKGKSNETLVPPIEEEQIEPLSIDPTDMRSNVLPTPPTKDKIKIKVRKNTPTVNSKTKMDKRKVLIARPADREPAVIPTPFARAPHHKLGSVQADYDLYYTGDDAPCSHALDQHKRESPDSQINQVNALKNWDRQMSERKRQKKHLSNALNVKKNELIMGQSDQFRTIQEKRTVIDRAMPAMDYGKGYRVGSEFWKQVETINTDDSVSITLTQTEKGMVRPLERIGYAKHVQHEMDLQTSNRSVHYPWLGSSYLEQRIQQLKPQISYQPEIDDLEIIGKKLMTECSEENNEGKEESFVEEEDLNETAVNDPLANYPDVIDEPVVGPSLVLNGQVLDWQGGGGCVEEVVRVHFECDVTSNAHNNVRIFNQGTTAVHYSWKKVNVKDPFGLRMADPIQKFYFNTCPGVILPNTSVDIALHFKSSRAGIFSETWKFETRPLLNGGARVLVVLRAVASKQDEYKQQREDIHSELTKRQNERMAKRLLNDLLKGVKTPPRPSTPQNITDEDLFKEVNNNNALLFKYDVVDNLKSMYSEINGKKEWDWSMETIYQEILKMEDEEKAEELMNQLHNNITLLQKPPASPIQQLNYNTCYQLLSMSIDQFVERSIKYRKQHKLPERILLLKEAQTQPQSEEDAINQKMKSGDAGRNNAKTPIDGRKTLAAPKKGKENQASPLAKPPEIEKSPEKPKAELPMPRQEDDSVEHKRYLQHLYVQVYAALSDFASNMDTVLS